MNRADGSSDQLLQLQLLTSTDLDFADTIRTGSVTNLVEEIEGAWRPSTSHH